MVELEVYAAGVRHSDKIMGLALELDMMQGLRYKVDTNHDIVYMELDADTISLADILSIFRKIELEGKVLGTKPTGVSNLKKTQRLT